MDTKYKAVVFDLFGTLVGDFTRREYDRVNERMAKLLGIPFDEFWQLVAETGRRYYEGDYRLFEDNLEDICRLWGCRPEANALEQAARQHYDFLRRAITSSREVLETLGKLKDMGLKTGLITDCGAGVPLLWKTSPLSEYIQAPVFSCEVCITKPDPAIYRIACLWLGVKPAECIYVGDGSSQELTSAAEVGLLPVLKRTDLTEVYDGDRPETVSWNGLIIDEISELPDLVSGLERSQ